MATGRQAGCWRVTVSSHLHPQVQAESGTGHGVGLWNLEVHPISPPTKPSLLILPKHFYQLGTKYSNMWVYRGHSNLNQHSIDITENNLLVSQMHDLHFDKHFSQYHLDLLLWFEHEPLPIGLCFWTLVFKHLLKNTCHYEERPSCGEATGVKVPVLLPVVLPNLLRCQGVPPTAWSAPWTASPSLPWAKINSSIGCFFQVFDHSDNDSN